MVIQVLCHDNPLNMRIYGSDSIVLVVKNAVFLLPFNILPFNISYSVEILPVY